MSSILLVALRAGETEKLHSPEGEISRISLQITGGVKLLVKEVLQLSLITKTQAVAESLQKFRLIATNVMQIVPAWVGV